ncbi:Pre-mRNA-splicing factor sap61 [Fulvia fulva]|uniref:Pre-mRNA-splicing factor sap61 n=1 Tax=Passalora fulva TaxID=5499 RepID=A0A9Q8PAW5_PASFU|nr:Pre-mRNA-splicing factor sap61 [Fulvia fulva]KAK4622206.1 Pre-mRNA-splicing factor sap61 [Fulvia fulva]KAK4622567.1 Pre-mRNA-splicing factor sap61 [Fulvia fulva]UJO19102.1 Pre-mRNA-splicing factor sap61 [Fulvia fulva]WPV16173.1 Pre-mRNA-splicing factor sap61 [Fulvia fulva]WPV31471.1 Pre-mRNA-splicing factor sap61 [Fulvia fulva]
MIYEDLRAIHEDVERLEQAIADRVGEDPKHIRSRLIRDHEISNFLERIERQSQRALQIYNEEQAARLQEVQAISTGDTYATFYEEYGKIKDYHKRYPNEPVENLERAYNRVEDGGPPGGFAGDIDAMFTGEEASGRFFDLTMLHEEYLNLPGIKGVRKLTYLQYLDNFDAFTPPKCNISRQDKMTDQFFSYVGALAQYLESFLRKTKPLEDLEKLFRSFDDEFEQEWEADKAPGWQVQASSNATTSTGPVTEGTGEGIWCADCQKEFKNDNVYKAHLTGKKHIKNAEAREKAQNGGDSEMAGAPTNGAANGSHALTRLKERAVAEREHRVRKLAATMKTEREDTRVNVERKAGMTDKERQQELAELYAEDQEVAGATTGAAEDEDDADGEKIYNPLKLPLAWDGKPIPFWLYKLHGLGVEFPCEICGNYVYMGRRAFDKHFSEARHIYGLQCLGITKNTGLFREITKIEEAEKLWEKLERDRAKDLEKKGGLDGEGVVEMEDAEGNVMPKKVYDDLEKAGFL